MDTELWELTVLPGLVVKRPCLDVTRVWNPTPHVFRELGINRKGLGRGRDSENPPSEFVLDWTGPQMSVLP